MVPTARRGGGRRARSRSPDAPVRASRARPGPVAAVRPQRKRDGGHRRDAPALLPVPVAVRGGLRPAAGVGGNGGPGAVPDQGRGGRLPASVRRGRGARRIARAIARPRRPRRRGGGGRLPRRRPLRANRAAHRPRAAERAPRDGLPAHPPPPAALLRPQPDRHGPHPGDERRGGSRREPGGSRPLSHRGPPEDGRVPRDDVLVELEGDPRPARDAARAPVRDGFLPAPGSGVLSLVPPGALRGDRVPPGMPRGGEDGAALRGGGEGARRLRAP